MDRPMKREEIILANYAGVWLRRKIVEPKIDKETLEWMLQSEENQDLRDFMGL